MTPSELHDLVHYNSWAHRRLFDVIAGVPEELYMKQSGTSHGNMHGTVTHTVGAEELWLNRWTGKPATGIRKPDEFSGFSALRKHWEIVDSHIHDFCSSLTTENAIRAEIAYSDLKGNRYSQPLVQLIQHMVNHSSFHRGQMVMFLRQFSFVPVSTDMVVYFREKKHN